MENLKDKVPSDSITTGFCYRLVCCGVTKYSTLIDSCAGKKTASMFDDGSCGKPSTCTFIWFSVWVKPKGVRRATRGVKVCWCSCGNVALSAAPSPTSLSTDIGVKGGVVFKILLI